MIPRKICVFRSCSSATSENKSNINLNFTRPHAINTNYNPSINFRAILLATLRHVVQIHRTVITQ